MILNRPCMYSIIRVVSKSLLLNKSRTTSEIVFLTKLCWKMNGSLTALSCFAFDLTLQEEDVSAQSC